MSKFIGDVILEPGVRAGLVVGSVAVDGAKKMSKRTLLLPYPVSANRYWRTFRNRNVLSQEAKEYKRNAAKLAAVSGVQPTNKNVRLTVLLHPKTKKDGTASLVVLDLDNCLKVTIDALKNVGYYDDKQVKGIVAEYGEPVTNGALTVKIEVCL